MPPQDFTGRELQGIRIGLFLSTRDLAEMTKLTYYQIEAIEDERTGFNNASHHSFKVHAIRRRMILALHLHIRNRGPTTGNIDEPRRAKRRCGRKPKPVVSAFHL